MATKKEAAGREWEKLSAFRHARLRTEMYFGSRDPATLKVCSLLIKPERLKTDVSVDYVGFEIPNRFAIGYGLDFRQRWRNLPYVASLNRDKPGV